MKAHVKYEPLGGTQEVGLTSFFVIIICLSIMRLVFGNNQVLLFIRASFRFFFKVQCDTQIITFVCKQDALETLPDLISPSGNDIDLINLHLK